MRNNFKIIGEVTEIYLNRRCGKTITTLIDTEDLNVVSEVRGKWYAVKNKMGSFYVFADVCKGTRSKGTFRKNTHILHRVIMNPPHNMVVDHINHDTLDNRRENLRVITVSENNQNRNVSHVTGVYPYHYDKSRWSVIITCNKKVNNLGIFDTKEEAESVAIKFKIENQPFSKVAREYENT